MEPGPAHGVADCAFQAAHQPAQGAAAGLAHGGAGISQRPRLSRRHWRLRRHAPPGAARHLDRARHGGRLHPPAPRRPRPQRGNVAERGTGGWPVLRGDRAHGVWRVHVQPARQRLQNGTGRAGGLLPCLGRARHRLPAEHRSPRLAGRAGNAARGLLAWVQQGIEQSPPTWKFNPLYWDGFLFNSTPTHTP